jgi:hypothetical protein
LIRRNNISELEYMETAITYKNDHDKIMRMKMRVIRFRILSWLLDSKFMKLGVRKTVILSVILYKYSYNNRTLTLIEQKSFENKEFMDIFGHKYNEFSETLEYYIHGTSLYVRICCLML